MRNVGTELAGCRNAARKNGEKIEGTEGASQVENWASWKGTEKSLWRRDYPDISAAESAIRKFFFPFFSKESRNAL